MEWIDKFLWPGPVARSHLRVTKFYLETLLICNYLLTKIVLICMHLYIMVFGASLKDKYPNFEVGLKCIIMLF